MGRRPLPPAMQGNDCKVEAGALVQKAATPERTNAQNAENPVKTSTDQSRERRQENVESGLNKSEVVDVGGVPMTVGSGLACMVDSTPFLHDSAALTLALGRAGYVLLRGVLPREKVLAARQVVTASLHGDFDALDVREGRPQAAAWTKEGHAGYSLSGFSPITTHKDVVELLEGPELQSLFRTIFQERPVSTFSSKWVRVKAKGESTDAHSDFYRFADAAAGGMYTCWIPLGDYAPSQGVLAVCEGSHNLDPYLGDDAPGVMDAAELPPTFFKFRDNATWRTARVAAGDVVVFDIHLVHASTANLTSQYRISMDTRWIPGKRQGFLTL